MRDIFDNDALFKRCLLGLTVSLFAWSVCTDIAHNQSWEATTSAGRLVLETVAVLLALRFRHGRAAVFLLRVAVVVAVVNSVVVVIQLLETVEILPTNFSWLIEDFWRLDTELTRKTGLFNGVLTSSLLSFMLLAMLGNRGGWLNQAIVLFALISILFGARTFLIFLPLFLLFHWRSFVVVAALGMLLVTLVLPGDLEYLLTTHLEERIIPTTKVVTSLDPDIDHSSRDLARNHYRMPEDVRELMVGNGQPRYSIQGGQDPATMRWLIQTGFPGFIIAMTISTLICWRVARLGGVANLLFALSLVLVTFKGELVTATLIYSTLLIYIFASPRFFSPANTPCTSRRFPSALPLRLQR